MTKQESGRKTKKEGMRSQKQRETDAKIQRQTHRNTETQVHRYCWRRMGRGCGEGTENTIGRLCLPIYARQCAGLIRIVLPEQLVYLHIKQGPEHTRRGHRWRRYAAGWCRETVRAPDSYLSPTSVPTHWNRRSTFNFSLLKHSITHCQFYCTEIDHLPSVSLY